MSYSSGNDIILIKLNSILYHSDILHSLRDVNVIKEKIFPVELQGSKDQLTNWEGYGLRIIQLETHFPKMHVTALAGGKFVFPENTILVSAVYAVSTSIPIPMRLELQHCIDLSIQPAMRHYLRFATASIDNSSPYKFFLRNGEFQSDSWYGSFYFNSNCFICILGLKEVAQPTSVMNVDHKIMHLEQQQQGSQEQQRRCQLIPVQGESQQDELQHPGGYKQENEASNKPEAQQLEQGKKKNGGKRSQTDKLSLTKKPKLSLSDSSSKIY